MKAKIFLIVMVLVFVVGCEQRIGEENECSLEAKICPDGTAVGRTGPNCEFTPCPIEPESEDYCETNSDCACGKHKETGNCFYGNKYYVNTEEQCPDYCTGITGNLKIICEENKCKHISTMEEKIKNFEECIAAGNPAMESYPRQCRANDETFVEEIDDQIFCTADVQECPDGSYVARVPPTCEFAPCP